MGHSANVDDTDSGHYQPDDGIMPDAQTLIPSKIHQTKHDQPGIQVQSPGLPKTQRLVVAFGVY